MHRARLAPLMLTLTAVVVVRPAAAQSLRIGIGAGVIAPAGTAVIGDNAGWHVLGKVAVDVPLVPISVRVDGLYGQLSHQGGVPGHTSIGGVLASLVWHIPTDAPQVKPYLLAGAGVYRVQPDTAAITKLAFGVGGGVAFGHAPLHFSVEGRYLSVRASGSSQDFNFIPITGTVSFGGP
jgi:Outer membrane protein beta-barrel domain